MEPTVKRLTLALVTAAAVLPLLAAPSAAHPLGNYTTNTSANLVVTPMAVEIGYVVDLAEIPALRVVQQLDGDGDRAVSDAEGADHRQAVCAAIARGVEVRIDEQLLDVRVASSSLQWPPGEAGLATMRLECALLADLGAGWEGERVVTFTDTNLDGRIGWREVTAMGSGTVLTASDVPTVSPTDQLRAYPHDRLAAPLDVRRAALRAHLDPSWHGGGVVRDPVSAAGPLDRLSAFTDLVEVRDLSAGIAVLAVAVALGLGALHALAPGHGKTVMAAYLLGRDAGLPQVAGLALAVAIAHTAGVLLLGALVGVTEIVAPDRLYAWLGIGSGLLFSIVGVTLLRQARRHHHDHEHPQRPGWRAFVAPGLAGGLVPTPSALVVLLGGIALNRTWFGILLVLAYGLGMGAVLVAAGWALSHARGTLAARVSSPRLARAVAVLPTATATLLVLVGLGLAVRAAAAL
jgi:nickel/cobalt transporter (NicO) family protein